MPAASAGPEPPGADLPGAEPPGADLPGAPAAPPAVHARPRRLRRVCAVLAAAIVATFGTVALLLPDSGSGAAAGPGDRVAVLGLGLVAAAAVLALGRPVVEADERGVRVRNVVGRHEVPWAVVTAVTFAEGSPWARLDLADDDTLALLAVQASDGQRAVAAVRGLRALHQWAHGAGRPA